MNSADLYRNAFVLDCNTLASIGLLAKDGNLASELQAIRDSGLGALKSTLGAPMGRSRKRSPTSLPHSN